MKVHPQVLVLVGMPGAGKSSCVEHLESKGIPNVYFGGVIVDETKRRNNGQTSEALEKVVRLELRATEGNGAVAARIMPKIDKLLKTHPCVVADGLYSWTEYKIFKEHYGKRVLIVAITAPRHIRHERLAHRPVRPLTEEEVVSREYVEIEHIEKGGPIANADYTLVNDSDPAKMLQDLDNLLIDTGFLPKPE